MTYWNGNSEATKERFERVLNWGNGSGTGKDLLQTYIDRVVQFLSLREMGLLAVLDRRQGSGPSAFVNQRTSASGGAWENDTTNPTAVEGTFDQKEFKYRTLQTRGEVSRKMQAIGQSYIDILAMEMAGKAEDFASALESGLIMGSFGSGSVVEPHGLLTLCENANRASAGLANDGNHIVNNAVGLTTSYFAVEPVQLAKLAAAIDKVKGSAMRSDLVIVGSFAAIRQVNTTLQANQRFINETEIAAGFRVRTYDGIPMVVSSEMLDTLQFKSSTTLSGHVSNKTGGTGCQLFIINKRHVFISELTPTTILPLAKTTSVTDSFDMYWDGAPVLANDYGMAILSNIASDGVSG